MSTETKIMFKIDYGDRIEQIDVVKETESYVTYLYQWGYRETKSERRERKNRQFFPTWEAARDELLTRARKGLESANEAVARYGRRIAEIEGMKKP